MSQMTPGQIKAALDAGIISLEQAKALRTLYQTSQSDTEIFPEAVDSDTDAAVIGQEDLRFLRSFSDVFIAIGVGIFVLGLSIAARLMGGGISYLLCAGLMWVMAEYFGRKKRAHLPTLITALAFLFFVHGGVSTLVSAAGLGGGVTTALITLLAMFGFYTRIHLPFCMALIALSLLYLFYTVLFRLMPEFAGAHIGLALIVGGAITFSTALYYDTKDLHRTTRFSDNAFWLHLTAAPLLIHGLAVETVRLKSETVFDVIPIVSLSQQDAALVMIAIGVICLIGLAINRRALIVSSLGYGGIALGFLIRGAGLDFGNLIALTFVLLGLAIVFLGSAWHPLRNRLIKILPRWKVFPPPYEA